MAEIELGVYCRNLLAHIPDDDSLTEYLHALTEERNANHKKIDWQFRTHNAHIKLKQFYPSTPE